MTADIIPMKEPRQFRVRRALDDWYQASEQWIEKTLTLALELKEARDECGGDDRAFGHWLIDNDCEIGPQDRIALIGIARHISLSRQTMQETTRRSVQLIWREEIKPLTIANASKDVSAPTKVSEPPVLAAVSEPIAETASDKQENQTPRPGSYPTPKKSKLHELLGPKVADVLHSRFKHPRMFSHLGKGKKDCVILLRYLAERCVKPDYPDNLFLAQSWTIQLLYPHLPQALLARMPAGLPALYKLHTVLVETERRFVLTPEFGVTDPPMTAFNKTHEIYTAIINARNGHTFDRSAVHRATYANDEGKQPVIIRGTQLWPAEADAGYGYEDLRCAHGLADDILKTFDETRNAPMSTRSLKLRHVLSWLPGGYNSTGSSMDGTLRALRTIVQAYSTDKSDVMRTPSPSLKKLDE
jgi:hypothetical protein